MNKKILKLKIDNKDKNLEKHLRPQWSVKNLISIILFFFILFTVAKDLDLNFIKLITKDTSKYFGDILSRMILDFSKFLKI